MRYLYTLLFYLAVPFLLLRLLWRARKNPGYAKRIGERLGCYSQPIKKNAIWIHAVSMGETIAATPLIKKLQQRYPNIPIVITNTTLTGAERTQLTFGDSVTQLYFPYDVPDVLQRFLTAVAPRCLIVIETELWPNLFHLCAQKNIPVFIANARLSQQSAEGYQRFAALTRPMLQCVTSMAVQTQAEADRFIQLGLDATRMQVTGSIKFDLEISADLWERAKQLRAQLGNDRLIWIAASTHEGEEEKILAAFAEIKKQIPNALLMLVPRHPERFERVADLCLQKGYKIIKRSENKNCNNEIDIFLGDSLGELLLFYGASDIAFVGGSLIPVGGHNPLEPAAMSVPIIMGPQLFNFLQISEQLQQAGAMLKIENTTELAQQIIILLQDKNKREQMGVAAQKFVAQNRGAVAKHLALIEKLMNV
jgi:3-deoxy-D-manno-octulosonic-acid transferase